MTKFRPTAGSNITQDRTLDEDNCAHNLVFDYRIRRPIQRHGRRSQTSNKLRSE